MASTERLLPSIDLRSAFARAIDPSPSKPWDSVIDFAVHPDFCGNDLYPRQATLLKLIYLETEQMTDYDKRIVDMWSKSFADKAYTVGVQEDIWDRVEYLQNNGYDHFREVQGVMGRRASKGHMGGILFNERLSSLVAMDDPQSFFGIEPGHDIYALVVATTGTQAQKFLFADVLSQVRKNRWLTQYVTEAVDHQILIRTPADIRNTAKLISQRTPPRSPLSSVKAIPVSSNSDSSRGGAVIAAGFDEFAFTLSGQSKRAGSSIYSAIEPSLDQFGKHALLYMPSSPWSKVGKFYELYEAGSVLLDSYLEKMGMLRTNKNREKLENQILEDAQGVLADPTMLIAQMESWDLYEDWEDAPRILATPDKRYFTRSLTSSAGTKVFTNDEKELEIAGPNAIAAGDSLLIDDSVIGVRDIEPVVAVSESAIPMSSVEVVIPGPYFKQAIQVRPDKNGTPQQRNMAAMESRNPQLFRVERRAQFLSVMDPYLDPENVSRIFAPWKGKPLSMQPNGIPRWQYFMHADPAKSGADFAVMIAHVEPSAEPASDGAYYDHMVIDWFKVYQPHMFDNNEIDYLLIIADMKKKIREYTTLVQITMDQFNSVMPLQTLREYARKIGRQINIFEQTFTSLWNQTMWSGLKTAINLDWVHSPYDYFYKNKSSLLEAELLFLQEDNGKVIKGDNPDVNHDDLVDCLGTLCVQLLGTQLSKTLENLEELSLGVANQTPVSRFATNGQPQTDSAPLSALASLYDV